MLEELPHVGSIVAGADHERVARLLSWLRTLIDDRALRYSRQNAGTIGDYRRLSGASAEPRILLLLDGVAAFRQAYEVGDRSRWFDLLVGIANDGRPVGVHILLSADRPAAVPSALASAIQTRVALRMADANDYATLGVPADVLSASSPPGRGLLRGAEIQVAMLGKEPDVGSQANNIRRFAVAMARATTSEAPAIRRLGDRILLDDLPKEVRGLPVIGVGADSLGAHAFEPRGSFLVCGPPGSGRTTALQTMAVALRRWDPVIALHYLGNRRSTVGALDLWTSMARGAEEVASRAMALAAELEVGGGPAAVFIENVSDFANGPADLALQGLIRQCLAQDVLVVAEGETTTLSSGSAGLVAMTKTSRVGIALAPDSNDGGVLRTNFPPRLNRADFPPGRALFVAGGKTTVIQVGLPGD
jgi:S-DNA-T family DNA segregation ATPase FtsK/SpoIIIE